MMSSSIFLLCCFLIFCLYSLSQHTGYALDAKPTRKLTMSAPVHDHKTQYKMQGDEATESTRAEEDSVTPDFTSSGYSPRDLVYHIDYHGVTTHPTPKHPRP